MVFLLFKFLIMLTFIHHMHFFSKTQKLTLMESTQVALKNVVSAIFDGSNDYAGGNSEVHLALCRIFEGFFATSI